MTKTLVMKFGGAAVATPSQFPLIADIIISRKEHFDRIVTVVSAMGDTTDDLIALAKKINPTPPQREYDMLVSVGERISMSLLAMALAGKGCEAISYTGSQTGIITCEHHTEARIIQVKPQRILPALQEGKVIIVAGFQGVSRLGEITTLGRGGSDTTAVALAVALRAGKVEFFKDVEGIYTSDPKKDSQAQLYSQLTYDQAVTVSNSGSQVLHSRSIELARKNRIVLQVRSFHHGQNQIHSGTWIGTEGPLPEMMVYEEPLS